MKSTDHLIKERGEILTIEYETNQAQKFNA